MKTKEEARDVFLAQGNDDARALCFAALIVEPRDAIRLRRAAEMGFAFAQAEVSSELMMHPSHQFANMFSLASSAAVQGERVGFYMLGYCYRKGRGCKVDENHAKKQYSTAAKCSNDSVCRAAR